MVHFFKFENYHGEENDNETELMHFLLASQERKLWDGKRFNCLHICF